MWPVRHHRAMRDYRQGELELVEQHGRVTLGSVSRAFEPARLTQARILSELTKAELAEMAGISPAAVGQYEAGAMSPRTELIAALARHLDVPVEFFAAGRPLGRLDATQAHFRSLRATRAKDRLKAATHAEQLWELVYALEKRMRLPDVNIPPVQDGTSPQQAAAELRAAWGIGAGPFPHLVATMESNGLVVSLIPMTNEAVSRVSAYSTDALGRPLVIVTPERAQSVYRYRFTCAHELGHLVLHNSPLPGDRLQEREADKFAAELLTPSLEIEPLLPRTMRLAALDKLSRTWGVSVESLVRRMGELRVVSDATVRRAYQRLNSLKEHRRDEPVTSYRGEVPSLLRDAIALAEQVGLSRGALASELCWSTRHLNSVLGTEDPRPVLTVISSGA